jgi:hypothetical protein
MSTFTDAYSRLQQIHQRLSSQDLIDVDEILTLQDEATKCHDICMRNLYRDEIPVHL